jgi:prepilin-type N-terminal cleavage/methylation domain-containing protein
MQINTSRKSGFTLVEIMIVVAIIGLLAAIAIPNFVKARKASQTSACIANMKQLDGAKATWALENKKTQADTCNMTDIIGTDKYIRVEPFCPAATAVPYVPGLVDETQVCPNIAIAPEHVQPQ